MCSGTQAPWCPGLRCPGQFRSRHPRMFGILGSDRHVRAMRGMPIHSRDVFPRGGGRYNSPKKGRGGGGEIEIKGGGGRLRASEGVRARDDCGIYQLACGAFRHRAWVVGEHPLECSMESRGKLFGGRFQQLLKPLGGSFGGYFRKACVVGLKLHA